MFKKLEEIAIKYEELSAEINDPDVIADQAVWRRKMKEYSDMTPIMEKYAELKSAAETAEEAEMMLQEGGLEEDFLKLLKDELKESKAAMESLKKEINILLIPKDPNDDKNVIVEIRAGAGGDEAALFAGDMFRMYTRYADDHGWKTEFLRA